tara:strand:+ start:550 stop:1059 length:510 start_codon:yes stop_codon:yes gene_type:complete
VKIIFTLTAFIFASFFSLTIQSSEEDYANCILENMKDADNDVAANAIKEACEIKFIKNENYNNDNLDNDILVVCYYPGESFEIKYNRNNRNFVYWRGVDSDWEWTKSKIVQIDSSIIIFDWESRYKNPYFNRIKYEISRNKITWFHSVNKIEPSRDGCAKGEPISPTSF